MRKEGEGRHESFVILRGEGGREGRDRGGKRQGRGEGEGGRRREKGDERSIRRKEEAA
jgi:hypothetical protein